MDGQGRAEGAALAAGAAPANEAERFAAGYGFAFDDFQVAGIAALAAGRSTLVAAPTGAGKTVVGEFAVWQALERAGKCFYTTPIKALSNQKYADFVRRHGAARVGLLTGDNAINGDAPVVVMTTEVLRNMLYEGSRTLVGLHAVVLDEVHYLGDRERGAVWEEVIIQLPPSVQLACLSATVSNAEEFGGWLHSVRESCDVVISDRRPVPLEHHYAVNERIYPTFRTGGAKLGASPDTDRASAARQARAGVPNPELVILERRAQTTNRVSRRGRWQPSELRLRPPRRADLVRELRRRNWLPAICFVFSRDGCDGAVRQLLDEDLRLTSRAEQQEIRAVVDERTADLPSEDLEVLGYGLWAAGLEHGIAAHHAGMVPAFKEAVEELFVRGLVKVCFATETLALGINMPARTVVIERLEKWSGQRHELLTPGQFTQLTGRAGRRGLDLVGHAVVLYQREVDFSTVASLVSRRTEPLLSSFAPSYNMAVNLLRRHDRAEAEQLLARSFAQYQADATVAGEELRIARNRESLQGYARNLSSAHGDFPEYWRLRRELARLEGARARERRLRQAQTIEQAVASLREGDVVALQHSGRRPELVAIVERQVSAKGVPLASAVTEDRRLVRLGPREFEAPPLKVGRLSLPRSGGPRQSAYRKLVANSLRQVELPARAAARRTAPHADAEAEADARLAGLRTKLRSHPVQADPDLPAIEVWAQRYDTLLDDTERLERGVRRRTGSLVRQFNRIVGVLTELAYLSADDAAPEPTADGLRLAGLYAETDLLLAEAIRHGLLDPLDPAELAAVASVFVYETRQREAAPAVLPTPGVADAVRMIVERWQDLAGREEAAALPPTRPPDGGFAEIAWRWAGGAELDDVLAGQVLPAGDFVRTTKQVADLLRQIRDVMPGTRLAERATVAARALVRGVVAHTGL